MTPSEDAVEALKTAYSDAGPQMDNDDYPHGDRCLSFLMPEWTSPTEAAELAEYIGGYNCFTPERFAALMERVEQVDDSALVALGREGSPVAYIETDDAEAVLSALGDDRDDGVEEPEDYPFGDGRPDELGTATYAGSARRYAETDTSLEPHGMCGHEDPPTPTDEFAKADDNRELVRAWWD